MEKSEPKRSDEGVGWQRSTSGLSGKAESNNKLVMYNKHQQPQCQLFILIFFFSQ